MDSEKLTQQPPAPREDSDLSGKNADKAAKGRPPIRVKHNFLTDDERALKMDDELRIQEEAGKIKDAKVRHLYILRALHSIGDWRRRELKPEELTLLDRYIQNGRLSDEDQRRLDALVPDSTLRRE